MERRILIVEDDSAMREALRDIMHAEGYEAECVASAEEALVALELREYEVVLCDLRLPGMDGLQLLEQVRRLAPTSLFLLMTAHGSLDTAINALREGAHDYMLKPFSYDEIAIRIRRLIEARANVRELEYLRRELYSRFDFERLVAVSEPMREVLGRARQVASTRATVLLTGESGVGKEIVARAIHQMSGRRGRIFLPLNCASIPADTLESQLFGHVRGSFTGAVADQEGLFMAASGGTLFLDEIGEMPLGLQVKLLRVVESGEVLPVGSVKPRQADTRIIAATNRSLIELVRLGRFREDLYYRIAGFTIEIAPLRERRQDIPPLVEFFVQRHNADMHMAYRGVTQEAMRVLRTAPWRGNVRELSNVLERGMIVGNGTWVSVDDLPVELVGRPGEPLPDTAESLTIAVRDAERVHIEKTLAAVASDKKAAADLLGISLSTLYRKLHELGLEAD